MLRRRPWGRAIALGTLLLHPGLAWAQDSGGASPGAGAVDPAPADRKQPEKTPPAHQPASGDKEATPAETPIEDGGDELPVDRPPPAGKGVVYGVVSEAKGGDTVIEAKVSVLGTKLSALTDLDGRYRLELPPGTYQLRVFYELHKPARVDQVRVVAGQLAQVDIALEGEANAVDVIEVETQADTSSVEGQIPARKRSAATGDSVGRKEMAKSPDKNAAEAAKRVVGATIEGNRFVYVRGLGERYTNALLDGAPLPSPEPDKQAIPLDLFPTQILDGIVLVKTFTPDVPGDFSGGSIRIATRRYTDQWTVAGGLSLGINTRSSFHEGLTYPGSATDFLGFSSGSSRSLPSDIPGPGKIGIKRPDGSFPTDEEVANEGRKLNGPMTAHRRVTPPNMAGTFVASKGWSVGKEGKFGFLAGLTYDRKFEVRDQILRDFTAPRPGDEGVHLAKDARVNRGIDSVNWGLLAGLTYEADRHNRLLLTGLYSRGAENEASQFSTRPSDEKNSETFDTRLSFVARQLIYGQLRGEHDFKGLEGGHLDYSLSVSQARRDEPNRRGVVYSRDPGAPWVYVDDNDSGLHYFSHLTERMVSGSVDWTQPIVGADPSKRFKFGAFFSTRQRDFDSRRLRFKPLAGAAAASACAGDDSPERGCIDGFVTDDANQGKFLTLTEVADTGSVIGAHLNVFAGYMMLDTQLGKRVRVIIGPRVEASFQSMNGTDPSETNPPVVADYNQAVLLPSASVVYSPTEKVNLRASVTKTVARPQTREIAPFTDTPCYGCIPVSGNPNLVNTSIVNADLRFEFFPSADEVLAVSAFYKNFSQPIEQVFDSEASSHGRLTWENADGARLFGMEFEARKSLGFITPHLSPLSVVTNLTFSQSLIELDPVESANNTSQSRPLALQPPVVANAALDFEEPKWGTQARLSYNVVGKRLFAAGRNGNPDIYQQPRHQLDLVVSQLVQKHVEIKAAVSNIVDSPFEQTAGSDRNRHEVTSKASNVVSYYRVGQTVSLGVGLAY